MKPKVVILGDRGSCWVIISVLKIFYNARGTFCNMNKAKLLSYFKYLNNLHDPWVWENNLRYAREERILRISVNQSDFQESETCLPPKVDWCWLWFRKQFHQESLLNTAFSGCKTCNILSGKVSKRWCLRREMPKSLPSPWGTSVS